MTASDAGNPGTGPSGRPSALTPGMRWRQVFPGEERELAAMRRWLESLLPDCPARDDVTLVATELGTNAIRHTASGHGGWFAVDITWHQAAVRVAVTDRGSSSEPRIIDDPAGEHGRGLLVVKGLSVRTGVCGDHRGRLVWADVPWGDAAAAEPASPRDPYEAAIGGGQAALASRFTGVPAWFGRSTLQWWALAGGQLVAAPTVQELASVLSRLRKQPSVTVHTVSPDARTAQPADRQQRPAVPQPQLRPSGHRLLQQGGWEDVGLAGRRDQRAPSPTPRPGASAWQARTASAQGRPATATS